MAFSSTDLMLYCKGNLRPHYSGWSSFLILVSASCCVFSVVLNASFPLQTSRFELFLASLALEFQLLLSLDFFFFLCYSLTAFSVRIAFTHSEKGSYRVASSLFSTLFPSWGSALMPGHLGGQWSSSCPVSI